MLEFAGRGDVPVAAGAAQPLVRARDVAAHVHGETGSTGPTCRRRPAAPSRARGRRSSREQIRARDGAITLIPTGPLTNVALLLALHPDARPERIVLMGGSIGEGNRTPAAEFNIWADPEAARRVFESGIDVTMIGLDVTHQALDDRRRRRGAARAPAASGKVAAELLDFYAPLPPPHATRDLDGSPLHDPVAVAHVHRPGLVESAGAHRGRLRLGAGAGAHERRLARPPRRPPSRTPPSASASTPTRFVDAHDRAHRLPRLTKLAGLRLPPM